MDAEEYDLYRETAGTIDNAHSFILRPYGRLEGVLLVLDEPLDNFDASQPYRLTVLLERTGPVDPPPPAIPCRLTAQQVCRTIGGRFQEGAHRGEKPLL